MHTNLYMQLKFFERWRVACAFRTKTKTGDSILKKFLEIYRGSVIRRLRLVRSTYARIFELLAELIQTRMLGLRA